MSFFSGLLGSVGSSFVNSAIGSLTSSIGSSLFSAGSSLFSSIGSGLSGLFSDKAGSVDHNSLFPDVFESKESVVPSLSVAAPSVDMHGAGASSFSAVDRFSSSFALDDEPAPVKLPSALDSLPTFSSDAPLLQLRQPVTDRAQFDRLFPSFDASAPRESAEVKLQYDPRFIESRRALNGVDLSVPMSAATLEAAGKADGPNSGRTGEIRNFGADNFRSQVPTFGTMSAPRAGDDFFDRPVTSRNGEAVVGSSRADDLMLKMSLAMPGGAGAARSIAGRAESQALEGAAEQFARAGAANQPLLLTYEPQIGQGATSSVRFWGNDYVVKEMSPVDALGKSISLNAADRAQLAEATVREINILREARPDLIPETVIQGPGFIRQTRVEGLTFEDLSNTAKDRALVHMGDAVRDAENALGIKPYLLEDLAAGLPDPKRLANGWQRSIDYNKANFRFNADGSLKSWFDPVWIQPSR